jgi:hypothetical protein
LSLDWWNNVHNRHMITFVSEVRFKIDDITCIYMPFHILPSLCLVTIYNVKQGQVKNIWYQFTFLSFTILHNIGIYFLILIKMEFQILVPMKHGLDRIYSGNWLFKMQFKYISTDGNEYKIVWSVLSSRSNLQSETTENRWNS